ncbi:MAG: FKBP-type peptidyl-prolyl cis-trans isomerase [Candidatus Didemnitutus sp.]|nr:FKBP-type peptidyl-prolyl cis-trans isomerase [Candidatus Didemnitutus sp.]
MSLCFRRRFALLFTCCALFGAVALHAQREKLPPEDLEIVEQRWPNAQKTSSGLRYIVVKEGERHGPQPEAGMFVKVLYKGELLDGSVFDQSQDPADPFIARIGRGDLIDGWDQAILRMRKGEKWILIVPYELGYGTRGHPPRIPKRATLIFEMELLDFGRGEPAVPSTK